ncbi:MAG: sodium:alanine symporter family protein [Lentisphaeria bacterium]|nr:sodium:alanine symporter family protein [Lentisphaeria bacterium]
MEEFLIRFTAGFAYYLKEADAFLWGPPLLILLLGTHLFYTFRLKFVQKHLLTAFRLVIQKDDSLSGNVAPFAALAVALASTIGTGNVIGVATAIALGGPGAVFWCMLTGVFGMSTKYAESLLAVKYRVRDRNAEVHGGPMYTILMGLKWKWMAVAFCIVGIIAVMGTGNLVQSNAIATIVEKTYHVSPVVTGLAVSVVVGLVIVGGLQSIAKVCTILVPFMSFTYLAGCFALLVMNFHFLDDAIMLILTSAFSPKAAAGGALGYGFMLAARYGVARGLFSNEAGMGSEPIVAATAQTRNAVRQGLVSYTGTFCTIIICFLTGLVIISGYLARPDHVKLVNDGLLTQSCFEQLPYVGKYLLSFAIFAFAITTLFGWFYYGEQCLRFIIKAPRAIMAYKIIYTLVVYLGAVGSLSAVWDFANFANGLMVIPNILSLLLLHKVVVAETKKYLWSGKLDESDPKCIRGNKVINQE